jgi:hypothetical protein
MSMRHSPSGNMLKQPKRQSSPRGKSKRQSSPRGKPKRQSSPRGKVAQEASPRGKVAQEAKQPKRQSSPRGKVAQEAKQPMRQSVCMAKEGTIVFWDSPWRPVYHVYEFMSRKTLPMMAWDKIGQCRPAYQFCEYISLGLWYIFSEAYVRLCESPTASGANVRDITLGIPKYPYLYD